MLSIAPQKNASRLLMKSKNILCVPEYMRDYFVSANIGRVKNVKSELCRTWLNFAELG